MAPRRPIEPTASLALLLEFAGGEARHRSAHRLGAGLGEFFAQGHVARLARIIVLERGAGVGGLRNLVQNLRRGRHTGAGGDQSGNAHRIDAAAAGLEGIGGHGFRQGDVAERQRGFRRLVERIDAGGAQVEAVVGGGFQCLEDGVGGGRPLALVEPDRRVAPAGVKGVNGLAACAQFGRQAAGILRCAQKGGAQREVDGGLFRALNLSWLGFGGLRWRRGRLRRGLSPSRLNRDQGGKGECRRSQGRGCRAKRNHAETFQAKKPGRSPGSSVAPPEEPPLERRLCEAPSLSTHEDV